MREFNVSKTLRGSFKTNLKIKIVLKFIFKLAKLYFSYYNISFFRNLILLKKFCLDFSYIVEYKTFKFLNYKII